MQPNTYLIDHSTNSPIFAENLYKKCQEKQIYCIDAPVSGGEVGAIKGRLTIMCGGD